MESGELRFDLKLRLSLTDNVVEKHKKGIKKGTMPRYCQGLNPSIGGDFDTMKSVKITRKFGLPVFIVVCIQGWIRLLIVL